MEVNLTVEEIEQAFIEEMKVFMAEYHVSVAEIAKMTSLSRWQIYRYLSGECFPKAKSAKKIIKGMEKWKKKNPRD